MGWGQEAQVGAQAVAEEAVAVVSGAAAAVSCRRAGRAESRMEQGEVVKGWQDCILRRTGNRVDHSTRRLSVCSSFHRTGIMGRGSSPTPQVVPSMEEQVGKMSKLLTLQPLV